MSFFGCGPSAPHAWWCSGLNLTQIRHTRQIRHLKATGRTDPKVLSALKLWLVAGVGFEPTTSGL
jgi:hypothetical protein